jgi:hypothetical protein
MNIISCDKKPQYAVIPVDEWQELQNRLEDQEDISDAQARSARIASGADEIFPSEFVDRLLSAEHPLAVWREFRGMTRCVFRPKSATDSDRSRPPIPIHVGHLFRLNPATP